MFNHSERGAVFEKYKILCFSLVTDHQQRLIDKNVTYNLQMREMEKLTKKKLVTKSMF